MCKHCAEGNMSDVKRLIMQGVDFEDADYDGRTPLHLASSEGQLEVIEYLVDAGLKNINPIDRYGNTPYDDAVRGNFDDITLFLKQHGGLARGTNSKKNKGK